MKRLSFWLLVPVIMTVPSSLHGADAKKTAGDEFFEKKIRPVLVANCFKCHSTGKKPKGKLFLDSRAALLKGGETGPAIVSGDPARSLLIKAISYKHELRMPPRSKLPDATIADLTAWVKMGAPWPGGDGKVVAVEAFDFEKRRKHWSFQPVKSVLPPAVKDVSWCRTGIDRFLLAGLEGNKLRPAAQANRRTLIRRLTFDLTGLPPTSGEIASFLADKRPGPYERLVDRLLASPAYGERWGRHWLDLMRFAETSGHEFDFEIQNAAGYRDYVIRALNGDVGYDQFVTEHLAGDLLEKPRRHRLTRTNESILGTGFWFLGESKHSPVDIRGDGADRRDNQIDVFGKAFLGLTISCARCHDHKFDPIYTKDYYALISYLQSSRQQQAFIDHPDTIGIPAGKVRAARNEASALAVKQTSTELLSRLKTLPNQLEKPSAALKRTLGGDRLFAAWNAIGSAGADFPARKKALAAQWRAQHKQVDGEKRFKAFDDITSPHWRVTGHAFAPATVNDVELRSGSLPVNRILGPGGMSSALVSNRLQGALRSRTFTIDGKFIHYHASGRGVRFRLVIDGFQLIQDPIYGGLAFTVNSPLPRWYVQNVSMWQGLKAYIELLDDGDGHASLDRVVFADTNATPGEAPNVLFLGLLEDSSITTPAKLADGYAKLLTNTVEAWRDGKLAKMKDVRARVDLLNLMLASSTLSALAPAKASESSELTKLLTRIRTLEAAIPAPRRALAMADGNGVDERVYIRGNHRSPGEAAPRRLPVVLLGDRAAKPGTGSGRLDMAKRLVEPSNPLTARVIVNRLWQHHFGAGLVRSVDDFGHQGEKPTHPELLDWLASELVRSGWSLKHLHRLMVTSAAYRMSSKSDETSERRDPRNALLHRMAIRRLEAEVIRDAMLAVSGRLDRRMFDRGPLPHLNEFMIGRGRPHMSGPLDGAGRRSLYLNVRRNFLNPMFLAFDYPVPFSAIGRRSVSNVPAQALTLLNNPFVVQQASLWSERVSKEQKGADDRVKRMYQMAFGRDPSARELKDALDFVKEQTKEHGSGGEGRAWADLAHVMFNVKEFIFVK